MLRRMRKGNYATCARACAVCMVLEDLPTCVLHMCRLVGVLNLRSSAVHLRSVLCVIRLKGATGSWMGGKGLAKGMDGKVCTCAACVGPHVGCSRTNADTHESRLPPSPFSLSFFSSDPHLCREALLMRLLPHSTHAARFNKLLLSLSQNKSGRYTIWL